MKSYHRSPRVLDRGETEPRSDLTGYPRPRTGAISAEALSRHGRARPTRAGRDAGRIAKEVIAHLAGLEGTKVRVTHEIEADIADGAPEHVVRTVTENCRTLKFIGQGFERD